jgi:hypothetical protein
MGKRMRSDAARLMSVFVATGLWGCGTDADGVELDEEEPLSEQQAIVGGYETYTSSHPWMVSIFTNGTPHCGGVLVGPRWVLTTAHCVWWDPPEDHEVVAGDTDLTFVTPWRQVRQVDDYILHPDFDGFHYDIALMHLEYAMDVTSPKVETAQIASVGDQADGVVDPGVYGSITGWGDLEYEGESSHEQLMEVDVPIRGAYSATYDEEWIGAGYETGGKGHCHGDSGGPLLVPNAAKTGALVAGLTAWSMVGCAEPGFLGYYTRVPTFHDWIRETMGCDETPGDWDYCFSSCPCGAGKGDCDYDYHCQAGLRCEQNVGADYGYAATVDVCVPYCPDVPLGDPAFCQPHCPCDLGEGDCDSDADCLPGLICTTDTGADHGLASWVDVCERPCSDGPIGTTNYCSAGCPCGEGEADCYDDNDCATGLRCVHNVGAAYGFDWWDDVCLP